MLGQRTGQVPATASYDAPSICRRGDHVVATACAHATALRPPTAGVLGIARGTPPRPSASATLAEAAVARGSSQLPRPT